MTIKVGQPIENVSLPGINNQDFDLAQYKGQKVLLSFHRFATCPFCNLHVHQLVKNAEHFEGKLIIATIFDSPLDHLQKHAEDHQAPFYILADENNTYYQKFAVERSVLKTLKGSIIRFPSLLYALFIKGYWPFPIKGNMFSMPLEILIDEQGIVSYVHRGQDEGDHLPLSSLLEFCERKKSP